MTRVPSDPLSGSNSPGGRDIEDLEPLLGRLPARQRSAFAASCANRSIRLYNRYAVGEDWEDREFVRSAMDRIWGMIGPSPHDTRAIEAFVAECEHRVPNDDECATSLSMCAQSAAMVVAYAAKSLVCNDVACAIGAAIESRQAVETQVFLDTLPEGSTLIEPARSRGIALGDPRYAAEVDRQISDILFLQECTEVTEESLMRIRYR